MCILFVVELIPKQIVVGVLSTTILPGTPNAVSPEGINRAWAALASRYRYTQLQLSPDGAAANFLGQTTDDGITIQPPVIQYRASIAAMGGDPGDSAQDALTEVARQIGASAFQQLGVKIVSWASLPDNDGPGFVLRKLLAHSEDDFHDLKGAGSLMAGVKFIVQHEPTTYTILVEPLLRDTKMLFIDVDAQFAGPLELDRIGTRVREVDQFVSRTVRTFLERQ